MHSVLLWHALPISYPSPLRIQRSPRHCQLEPTLALDSHAEQVFCVFLFIAGASLFGVLLSNLDEILQNMSRESRRLSDYLERYISFMSEYR